MPYYEAAEYFENLGLIDAKNFYLNLEEYAGQAFTISYITKAATLESVKNYINKQLGDGKVDPQELQETIQQFAVSNGDDPLAPFHLDTIVRTNVQTAFAKGRYLQMKESENPYWQYFNVDPKADICIEFSGKVFRKDDPIWASIYPPNHFNCGSTVVTLSDDELEEERLSVEESGKESLRKAQQDNEKVRVGAGFDRPPEIALDIWITEKTNEYGIDKPEAREPVFATEREREEYKKATD